MVAVLAAAPAAAEEFDPAQVDAGRAIYQTTGANCEMCHEWTGTGRNPNGRYSEVMAGGPSLVASTMDRTAMIEIVSCGKMVGWGVMPQYRNDAWTSALRCWGKVAADRAPGEAPEAGLVGLAAAQVEAVVTYVRAVYQGQRMTLANCQKYFGDKSKACDLYR